MQAKLTKLMSRIKHEKSKPNLEVAGQKPEENGAKNRRNWIPTGILQGYENSQLALVSCLTPFFDQLFVTFS